MKKYSELLVKEKKKFWKENPLHGNIEIKIDHIDAFKMYCENDDTVVKELHWTNFCGWELTSLTLWNDLLKINTGNAVYDIGSYSGIYSLMASKFSNNLKIFAFDIQNKCLERLEKNIEINSINNVYTHRAACTNFDGETTFYFYEEKDIISSVAGLKPKKMNNLHDTVKAIKLDEFHHANIHGEKVELIKIDVEGAEQDTLKGMQNILKMYAPDVLIEVNDFKEIRDVKKLFPKGYKVYDINEDTLTVKKLKWYKRPSKHRNYLFTKRTIKLLKNSFSGEVE